MTVKEKKVELFYDLVFVYAISRVTLVLEEPVRGAFIMFTFLDSQRGIIVGAAVAVTLNLVFLNWKCIKYRPKEPVARD